MFSRPIVPRGPNEGSKWTSVFPVFIRCHQIIVTVQYCHRLNTLGYGASHESLNNKLNWSLIRPSTLILLAEHNMSMSRPAINNGAESTLLHFACQPD
jgi:hypothetical protein